MLSITYDTKKNRIFSDYMASHWPELAPMNFTDIWNQLTGLEKQLLRWTVLVFNVTARRLDWLQGWDSSLNTSSISVNFFAANHCSS